MIYRKSISCSWMIKFKPLCCTTKYKSLPKRDKKLNSEALLYKKWFPVCPFYLSVNVFCESSFSSCAPFQHISCIAAQAHTLSFRLVATVYNIYPCSCLSEETNTVRKSSELPQKHQQQHQKWCCGPLPTTDWWPPRINHCVSMLCSGRDPHGPGFDLNDAHRTRPWREHSGISVCCSPITDQEEDDDCIGIECLDKERETEEATGTRDSPEMWFMAADLLCYVLISI